MAAGPTLWRTWAMPNADTFRAPQIGHFVRRWIADADVIVDPFARNSRLATHRNDLNPGTAAEHHMDAADFCRMLSGQGVVADAVIFDPPYSPRQIAECYANAGRVPTTRDTQNSALYAEVRTELSRLLRPGGIALSFGWNSVGFGKWPIEELMLVCHGGAHNDTICMAQRKPSSQQDLFARATA